ncbi:UNVERIFIED_CONTAM: protein OBERON 4 [Sesamum radiatum]|uniref:Protein OBERON 4 n=1 Tax=Sesamum radiatum TaxID=300843 RepID=A0AAW2VJ76_SESRA
MGMRVKRATVGTSFQGADKIKDELDMEGENEGGNDVMEGRREGCLEEDADSTCDEKLSLQDQMGNEAGNEPSMEKTTQTLKDKGKSIALSPSDSTHFTETNLENRGQTPGSPSRARSVQSFASSFRTNSEGFTASMSFSGSQQFTHNPSCSLTHNVHDYEQSVGSKPLFQGVDWKALSLDENKSKENPAYQGMSSRENGLHQQSQLFQGNSTVPHLKVAGGSSKLPIGLERQLSFSKHLAGAQGFGTYDNGPEYSKDRKHLMTEKDNGSLQKSNDLDGKEQGLVIGADFAESIVTMIVSEPLHTMARRFNDMTGNQVACVKDLSMTSFQIRASTGS